MLRILTAILVVNLIWTYSSAHEIRTGPMKNEDLVAWEGVVSSQRGPSQLYILSTFPGIRRRFSVLKMEIQGFRHRLVFSSGFTGNETQIRNKEVCTLGRAKVRPNMPFTVTIRIQQSDIMVYWNGQLVFNLRLTTRFHSINKIKSVGVWGSARTTNLRKLTDKDLAQELQDPECGMVTTNIPKPAFCPESSGICRIVGGVRAAPGMQPWQAAIRRKYPTGNQPAHVCGATLIGSCYALSSAHCFETVTKRSLRGLVVRVGDYYNRDNETHSRDPTVEASRDLDIEWFQNHPNYNGISPGDDIVLIKLKNCASFNNFVKPACLPTSPQQFSIKRTKCMVSGWGATTESQRPNQYPSCLQMTLVNIKENSFCNSVYPNAFDSNSMLCAAKAGCADACAGDSGGPLICSGNGQSIKYTMWGITSWGDGCGRSNRPGVYTRLSSYIRWIYIGMKLSPDNDALINLMRRRMYHSPYLCIPAK